jgi:hypothetical protein
LIALELHEEATLPGHEGDKLLAYLVEQLQVMNLDFKSAHRTAPFKPELKVYKQATGIFDPAHQKLKNDYVWNIDYARARKEGILP